MLHNNISDNGKLSYKKYLIIFFVLVQGAVAFSCASDDEVLEVVDLSVNKEVVDFKSEAGTQI